MTKQLHRPGIYQILCIPTRKIYIGSTVDLRDRWDKHVCSLRRGDHRNFHLQRAWDKYGKANFEFSVLEFVDDCNLVQIEQSWIDKTRCTDRTIGFNIYAIAGSPGEFRSRVWKGFVDPNGNELTITNLQKFCRQHKLDFPSMHRLAKGESKLKSYKGWTHRNSPRKREYVKSYNGFITPQGQPIGTIINLAAFCRQHGLDKTHMVAVANGRIYSHRGWTYNNDRRNLNLPKTYAGFINPDGRHVIITNLKAFCREHELCSVHMYEVVSGKRKSHKGWTWRNQ